MLIAMNLEATGEQVAGVMELVNNLGLRSVISNEGGRTIIGLIGKGEKIPGNYFGSLPGVSEVADVEAGYELISKKYRKLASGLAGNAEVPVKGILIGSNTPVIMAGPCAVESRQQLFRIAEEVKEAGAHILRGGIFKPRSSVHSFQGLGANDHKQAEEALSWLREAGDQYCMPVITEVRGESQVDLIAGYADILQIGSRNMYDQDLLVAAARTKKPILLKRHFGAGIKELLNFAEYIAAEGNRDIILCERGIVPVGKGNDFTRYTLDLAAVPAIRKESYLPVIVDPSHSTGRRDMIYSMSCAAVAAGAHGLMIEVHYNPEEALVDGAQAITAVELKRVIKACNEISRTVSQDGGALN
jgi:3-deoxy-7-phosphoheptulonate synthase